MVKRKSLIPEMGKIIPKLGIPISQIDDFKERECNLREAYKAVDRTCEAYRSYLESMKEMLFEICKV